MMSPVVIGVHLLLFTGDVLVGAVHDERLAILAPLANLASIQHPDPMPLLVTHAGLTLVKRRLTRKVLFDQQV